MSQLGKVLSELIAKNHGSQRKFAVACGLDQATIHHAINDRPLSRENLSIFCRHISRDPEERFALLAAHLRDEASAARESVDLNRLVIRSIDENALAELNLDPALQGDLVIVAGEAREHQDVRLILASMATNIRRHREPSAGTLAAPKTSKKKARPVDVGAGLTPKPVPARKAKTG